MRDWQAFVRARLRLPGLPPERESRIVRELAAQLEDFYREALAGGASEAEADAHACRQIRDWDGMAHDVWLADRRTRAARGSSAWPTALETLAQPPQQEECCQMLADVLRDTRYGVRQLTQDVPGSRSSPS